MDGVDAVREPVRAARHLGLASQDLGVYPSATVAENLRFFGGLAGLRGTALSRRVAEVAEALKLGSLLERRARALSGGQKRRLHTAAALLHEPPLLLLDEPTVGADVQTRTALLEVVVDLARRGTAVCYSTHYLPGGRDPRRHGGDAGRRHAHRPRHPGGARRTPRPVRCRACLRRAGAAALARPGCGRRLGCAFMFALFGAGIAAFRFFDEHSWGTWERLRASGVGSVGLMVGKLGPPLVVLLAQVVLLLGVGVVLFGLQIRGSVPRWPRCWRSPGSLRSASG